MDKEHLMLLEHTQENTKLLVSIKEELVKEITLIKIQQVRLKYYILSVAIGTLVFLGKPELVSALLKF